MISRVTLVLICVLWAACSQRTTPKSAHDRFQANPSGGTARMFLNSLPSDFHQFDRLFGYDERPAPFYELPLHETLPQLKEYLPAEEVATKFVALASGAEWDADNVNALQDAYRELLELRPEVVVPLVMSLEANKRTTAIRFLFDGPHPSNSPFDEQVRLKLKRAHLPFLRQADEIYEDLVADEHTH